MGKTDTHHCIPKSQRGSNHDENLSRPDDLEHDCWHDITANRTPDQVAVLLLLRAIRSNGVMMPFGAIKDGLLELRPRYQSALYRKEAILQDEDCKNGEFPIRRAIAAMDCGSYSLHESIATDEACRRLMGRNGVKDPVHRDLANGLCNFFHTGRNCMEALHRLLTDEDTQGDPKWVKPFLPEKLKNLIHITGNNKPESLSKVDRDRLIEFLMITYPKKSANCVNYWYPQNVDDATMLSSLNLEKHGDLIRELSDPKSE